MPRPVQQTHDFHVAAGKVVPHLRCSRVPSPAGGIGQITLWFFDSFLNNVALESMLVDRSCAYSIRIVLFTFRAQDEPGPRYRKSPSEPRD
jgi:hypothetical protein